MFLQSIIGNCLHTPDWNWIKHGFPTHNTKFIIINNTSNGKTYIMQGKKNVNVQVWMLHEKKNTEKRLISRFLSYSWLFNVYTHRPNLTIHTYNLDKKRETVESSTTSDLSLVGTVLQEIGSLDQTHPQSWQQHFTWITEKQIYPSICTAKKWKMTTNQCVRPGSNL